MCHLLQSAGLIRVKEAGCWLTDARRIKAVITDKNGSSPRRRNVLQAKIKRRGWCKKPVGGCCLFNLNRLNYCCTYFLSGTTEFRPANTLQGIFNQYSLLETRLDQLELEFKWYFLISSRYLPDHEYFDQVSDTTSSSFRLRVPQTVKITIFYCVYTMKNWVKMTNNLEVNGEENPEYSICPI